MNHFYIKLNLTVISLCLLVLVLRDFPLISVARADRMMHCTGSFITNKYGSDEPNAGGYNVDVTCG